MVNMPSANHPPTFAFRCICLCVPDLAPCVLWPLQRQRATTPPPGDDVSGLEQGMSQLELRGQGEPSTSTGEGGAAGSSRRSSTANAAGGGAMGARAAASHRMRKFNRCLDEQLISLDQLRELSWSGVPGELRPLVWRLLLGYLPPNRCGGLD